MPAKAKLYATRAGLDAAVESLEELFDLEPGKWCPVETVEAGDDEGKYILPLPSKGSYKANHLFSNVVDYASWEPPASLPSE